MRLGNPRDIAAMALLASLPLIAAEKPGLPKDLPPYGELKPVKTPNVKELKLDNGLTVWLVPETGFPKVAFTIAVRGGYSADPRDRLGLADLIAATVTQGTSHRSAKQLAEEVAAAGGDLNADATADSIIVETSVLSAKTEDAIGILADVMANANFADSEVEIAKSNVISGLEANEADPSFLGRRALYRAMYGDHPYAVIAPTKDSVSKTTAAELRREYARRFRPDRTLLVVAGDFTEQGITPAIRTGFGAWKAAGEAAPINEEKPKQSVSRAIVYVPRANSVQTAFYIGQYGPTRNDGDYAASRVATAIYGGMFGSRLISNIREDKGYTYSPNARLSPNRTAGLLITGADVRNPVTGASYNEIQYELNRMATTAPEAGEVESAKRYILGSTAVALQARQSVTRTLARLWTDSLPADEIGNQTRKVANVKPEDVEAVGRKYFPAWRATVVAVGEEKVIKDELTPFGLEFQKAQ
jgi:predicted Zn-dependent peptidase